MSITGTLTRAWWIAATPLAVTFAAQARAQATIRPMTSVRLTAGNEAQAVRVVSSDSSSLVVENSAGERRTVARADITVIERRSGHAKRGAAILGGIGVVAGALLGAALVEGLCETSDCSDDVMPAMAMVGGVFGGVGAIGGAVIGHFAGGWLPMKGDVRVQPMNPVAVCLAHPRFEAQVMRSNERNAASHRQYSIGAMCASGTVVGVEFGNVRGGWTQTSGERVDQQFGTVITQRTDNEGVYYRGVFLEHPLTTGRVQLRGIVSYGEYLTDRSWFETSYMKGPVANPDYQSFNHAYPYAWGTTNGREPGASVGAKASIALGTRFSTGLTARLQRVGTRQQGIEAGLALSFRP